MRTPSTYSGDADLSAANAAVNSLPPSAGHALVMKSTVPVGTGRSITRLFARTGKALSYASCPEFLKEGSALDDFLAPDRVVIGDDGGWAGDAVAALYAPLQAPIVRTDVASAETVKLASNAFLATYDLIYQRFATSALDALVGADACVLVTEWPKFGELDCASAHEVMAGRLVVDARNFLDPVSVMAAGLTYKGIGTHAKKRSRRAA